MYFGEGMNYVALKTCRRKIIIKPLSQHAKKIAYNEETIKRLNPSCFIKELLLKKPNINFLVNIIMCTMNDT